MSDETKKESKSSGRPEYTDEQYEIWLKEMVPFLENGSSIYYSIKKAGLIPHKNRIYQRYAEKDWFWEKIDDLRREPGELVNIGIVTQVRNILKKIKRDETPSTDENKILMFYAEKSRSAQPFFVNRQETATVKPIEEVIDELDSKGGSVDDVAKEAEKQVVEAKPPVQDKKQTGESGTVSPQPDATPVQD